jgi:formylglycine-generating enzyme required for sulfatase activity
MTAVDALPCVHDLSPVALRELQAEAARAHGIEVRFSEPLRDGGVGPELVVVPPGQFDQGAAADETRPGELPRRRVRIERPYAIGRYAVTADEFERHARGVGLVWADHLLRAEGRQPVINVSALEVADYLDWLSAQTGRRYRLPSEAEWEYAARAGSATAYCFGDRLSCGEANIGALMAGRQSAAGWRGWLPFCVPLHRVCEVGSYPANVWGLHEVHGNVWELTADRWQGPVDPANPGAGRNLDWRVSKGGSWFEGVRDASFAARRPRLDNELDTNLGFRVLRELD